MRHLGKHSHWPLVSPLCINFLLSSRLSCVITGISIKFLNWSFHHWNFIMNKSKTVSMKIKMRESFFMWHAGRVKGHRQKCCWWRAGARKHQQTLICFRGGTNTLFFFLSIIYPYFSVVEVGGMVVFDCIAEGSPAPSIQWNVSPGDFHSRFQRLTNGSLQVNFKFTARTTNEQHALYPASSCAHKKLITDWNES